LQGVYVIFIRSYVASGRKSTACTADATLKFAVDLYNNLRTIAPEASLHIDFVSLEEEKV